MFKDTNAWENRFLDVADSIELYVFNEEVGIYEFIINYGENYIYSFSPKTVWSENIHLIESLEKERTIKL